MNLEIVKSIIDEWDPIGLLATHVPADEYIFEIEQISDIAVNTNDVDKLASGIYQTFIEAFSDTVFNSSYKNRLDVARRL